MYKLKPQYESFTVIDGEFAGKTYRQGEKYETVPPGEMKKFEKDRILDKKKKNTKKEVVNDGIID